MQKWIILIIICVIVILGIVIVLNTDIETDYTPETEIGDIDLRKTIVTLYFKDKDSGELVKESKLIDSKELLKNPYEELLKLLLDGPENSNYQKIIPEGTEVLNATINNGCVEINFSKSFQDVNLEKTELDKVLYSIYNTLSQLTEVTSIKVLIDGNEVDGISNIITKEGIENNIDNTKDSTNNNVISNEVI